MIEILTPDEMQEADRLTIAAGTPGPALMEAAGRAVADAAARMAGPGARILVLAGPGNNGGDGFVAARHLREAGRHVRVALSGERDRLAGDAAAAAVSYKGSVERAAPDLDLDFELVIDALFGAGLSRALDGEAAALVERVSASGRRVLAVDLPSGIDGRTGAIRGAAIRARRTVTFFRLKPGHLLLPGRLHCGAVDLRQIGIPAGVLGNLRPALFHDVPALWRAHFPRLDVGGHKYDRGHALVVSGPANATGAARLAAEAALRAGAGLVTLASPPDALLVNAAHLTAVMLRRMDGAEGLADLLADRRFKAVAIGPGTGRGAATRELVRACLVSEAAVVLDADALTSFEENPDELWEAIGGSGREVVLTPHAGEFARLFPDLAQGGSKVERARRAAARARAILILKGPDTVVAGPDGRASISDAGPPWLATAGSGDVLAGIVAGLVAQGMPAFEAASAAVWLHGEAARRLGPGLTADDLARGVSRAVAPLLDGSRA